MRTEAERNAQLKRIQARSAEQKRRVATGEMLVCNAANILPGETSSDMKPIFHQDAKPVTPLGKTSQYKSPHWATVITLTRKRWDEATQQYVAVELDAR